MIESCFSKFESKLIEIENNDFRSDGQKFLQQDYLNPEFIGDMLLEISNPSCFKNYRAIKHSLGFKLIVLTAHQSKILLSARFLWLENAEEYSEDIHDHAYDICARVVYGKVTESMFVKSSSAQIYEKYSFDGKLSACNEEEGLGMCSQFLVCKDSDYFLEHKQLHSASLASKEAGVLMLRGNYQRFESSVYRKLGKRVPRTKAVELSYEEYCHFANEVRRKLLYA